MERVPNTICCASFAGARFNSLWALLAYGLIAVGLFHPALPHLSTAYLGDGGDALQFVWNAWWMDRSLLHGRNPYWCDTQLLPRGAPLVFHTLSELPMTLVALLARCVGMPLAYNAAVVAWYPIAGACMFALARHLTGSALAGWPAGLAFMLCPFMASKLLGHFNMLAAALLPLFLLWLVRGLEARPPRPSWALGLLQVIMLLSNVHTAVFAANLAAWTYVVRAAARRAWRDELRRFLLVLGPALGAIGIYGGIAFAAVVKYDVRPERFGSPVWCPDLLSFLLPLNYTSWWRSFAAAAVGHPAELGHIELSVYLGWLVLPMAVLGWRFAPSAVYGRLTLVLFLAALILAIGPHLQWEREPVRAAGVKLYGPMKLYQHVPLLGIVGQSGRYLVIGYLAIASGVAFGVAAVAVRRGRVAGSVACAIVSLLIVADYGFRPTWRPPPAVLIPMGEGRVLDPRLGNAAALYAQTIHARGLVGGYIARIPRSIRRDYEHDPGVGWLFRRPEDRGDPPQPAVTLASLRRLGVSHVCIAPGAAEERLLRAAGLVETGRTAHDVVFGLP